MNNYDQILNKIGLPDDRSKQAHSLQSEISMDIKIGSNDHYRFQYQHPNYNHYHQQRLVKTQIKQHNENSVKREQFLGIKLKRILCDKIKRYFLLINKHRIRNVNLGLLSGKFRRNLMMAFADICLFAQYRQIQSKKQLIHSKSSGSLLVATVQKCIVSYQRVCYGIMLINYREYYNTAAFLEKVGFISKSIELHIVKRCFCTIFQNGKKENKKCDGLLQLGSSFQRFERNLLRLIWHKIIKHIQICNLAVIFSQKIQTKQKIGLIKQDRNALTNRYKQMLKQTKSKIDQQSSGRHKIKMEYIRTSNKCKQQHKQFVKKQTKLILQAEKVQQSLKAELMLVQGRYSNRKLYILQSSNSKNRVNKLYTQIMDIYTIQDRDEVVTKHMCKVLYQKLDYSVLFDQVQYHYKLNNNLRQSIVYYESSKNNQFTEKFRQQIQLKQQLNSVKETISTVMLRLLQINYWSDSNTNKAYSARK